MQLTMFRLVLTLALTFVSISLAAPALDSATLLQNGQDAQTLNAEFRQLSASDPCNSGQMACINGTTALCQFGSWTKQACPDSKKCFAIPSISSPGTRVVCTSKANALSLIEATGAKGGIVGLGSNNQTLPLPTTSLPPSATSSANSTSPDKPTVKVVTVTVTAGADSSVTPAPTTPAPTITLPPTTRTIDSAGVDSLLSSLSAEGVVFVTAAASATPSGSIPPSGSSDNTLPTATANPSDEMKERERVAIKIAAWRRRISYDS